MTFVTRAGGGLENKNEDRKATQIQIGIHKRSIWLDISRIDGFPVAENRIEVDRSTGLDCGSILDVDPVSIRDRARLLDKLIATLLSLLSSGPCDLVELVTVGVVLSSRSRDNRRRMPLHAGRSRGVAGGGMQSNRGLHYM